MPSRATLLLLLPALLLPLLLPSPALAGTVDVGPARSIEAELAELLAAERARSGLPPLVRDGGIDNVARDWAARIAVDGRPLHRPDLAAPFTGDWFRVGENVGVGSSAASLHRAFMGSPEHRANVLDDWEHVGIGVALRDDDVWAVVNFVTGHATVSAEYHLDPLAGRYARGSGGGGAFSDLATTVHADNVRILDDRGAAVSCATARYCPHEPLRRAELAAIVARALDLPDAQERFVDVAATHPYVTEIGALAAAGITLGCNPPSNDRFCPEDTLTRAQTASFLVRAFGLVPRDDRPFSDVDGSNVHRATIAAIATSGITRGCNPPSNTRYCPEDPVTRGQLASFLVRGLRG